MNKKVVIISILVLMILIGSIFLFKFYNRIQTYPECEEFLNIENDPNPIRTTFEFPECISDLAISKNSIKICKNSGIDRYPCMLDFIIANEDLGSCQDLSNVKYFGYDVFLDEYCEGGIAKSQEYCDNKFTKGSNESVYCYWGAAVNTPNIDLCNGLPKHSNACISDLAEKWDNPNACFYRSTNKLINFCVTSIAIKLKDTSICDKIDEGIELSQDRDWCYETV